MTINSSFGLEALEREAATVPAFSEPAFNPEKYRADLAGLELTGAQEVELLETLWSIMGTFARMGFTADVCGLIFAEFNASASGAADDDRIDASTKTEMPSNGHDNGGNA